MNKEINQSNSILGTVISIAAPLIQLLAISSVALSSQFQFGKFFVNVSLLPLVNLFIILLTLSIIGILIIRQGNFVFRIKNRPWWKFWKQQDGKDFNFIEEKQYQIQLLVKLLWLIQIPSFILFFLLIIVPFPKNIDVKVFLQYLSYAIFLITTGIILFWWVQDYFRRKNIPKPDDFIPYLLDTLRRHKLLKENPVEVLDQINLEAGKKLLRIKIENQTEYVLITDFFGLNLEKTWSKDEAPDWAKERLNSIGKPVVDTERILNQDVTPNTE